MNDAERFAHARKGSAVILEFPGGSEFGREFAVAVSSRTRLGAISLKHFRNTTLAKFNQKLSESVAADHLVLQGFGALFDRARTLGRGARNGNASFSSGRSWASFGGIYGSGLCR